jgi:hypothetical protein
MKATVYEVIVKQEVERRAQNYYPKSLHNMYIVTCMVGTRHK